jgi:2-phosphosulfolactate phosphatase
MNIRINQLVEGAREATGLTVVIDVFRAFSSACYVMAGGAERILAVGEVETALDLKKDHPEYILMGERNEIMPPGFDFGNSPSQLEVFNFTGKTVVQTTSAGTRGLVNAGGADEIITGSFVNADAIVRYIRSRSPENVSLVCMGYSAQRPIEEDTFCAHYIRNCLQGLETDFQNITDNIRETSGARFFIAENQDHAPSTDFYLCLDLNRFDFILSATKLEKGMMELYKKSEPDKSPS